MTRAAPETVVAVLIGGLIGAAVLATGLAPPVWLMVGVLAILLSAAVMHQLGWALNRKRLSLTGFWYLTYVTTAVIPGFIVAQQNRGLYANRYLFAVESALFTVPLGMALVSAATGFRRAEIDAFFRAPLDRTAPGPHRVAVFVTILAVSLLLTASYLIEAPTIPLLELIRNPGSLELVLLREEAFKLLDSPLLYAYAVLRTVVYPFLIPLALGYFLVTRSRLWGALFAVTAVAGFGYAASSLAKLPAAVMVLIGCFFLYLYVGGEVSLKRVLLAVIGVLAFPVLVLFGTVQDIGVSVWSAIQAIFGRLFVLPATLLYSYFEIFPDHQPFLHGRTIGRVAWMMGEPAFDVGNYVYQYLFPEGIQSGTAPAGFIGNLYADFGMAGVLAGGLVAGAIMQAVQVHLMRRTKDVMTLAAHAVLYYSFLIINLLALPEALLSGGIVLVLVLLWALRVAESFAGVATSSLPASQPPPG